MSFELIQQLQQSLATSDSLARKEWSRQVVDERIPLETLLPLLHSNDSTSQRFMWLIGDICERDSDVVVPCMPILFSLRSAMPFPGMPRSVAKWLWLTNVPSAVEREAIPQLLSWLSDSTSMIACKSYAAKALFELAGQGRVSMAEFKRILTRQSKHKNSAYGSRMRKLLAQLN